MDGALPLLATSATTVHPDFPWLSLIVLLPAAAALLIPLLPGDPADPRPPRLVAFGVLLVDLLLMGWTFSQHFDGSLSSLQLVERVNWVPAIHLEWSLAADGLSAPLVVLSGLVTLLAVAASWNVSRKPRLYFSLLLVQASAQAMVFLSQDFLLFFLAWELELVPVYLLIAIWGGTQRQYAATKFILYTATASLLILVSGLALALSGDTFTLNLSELASRSPGGSFGLLCYLGFLIGFGVKLPMFPLHTWLPDAHGEANAPVSMLLAGVLLKMGGYGIIRIAFPLCPYGAQYCAWGLVAIGVVSIIYGAFAALAQTDFKRLVAYSSVSHMGYVLLGLAIWKINEKTGETMNSDYWQMGLNGAMFQMIAHGISSTGMFFMVGVVYDRVHHRDLNKFGGLMGLMPLYSGLAAGLFFAGLGLPGLCGFIGEVFVVISTWSFSPMLAVISAAGVILTAGYILWAMQRVYLGAEYRGPHPEALTPSNGRENAVAAILLGLAIVLGVYPAVLFDVMEPSIKAMATATAEGYRHSHAEAQAAAGQAQAALDR
ncbi:MAG: NADH-quinone oxidoreductase subunit M [Cyanobacteriota bacterium]